MIQDIIKLSTQTLTKTDKFGPSLVSICLQLVYREID
jgi:hypothetical protein